MGKNKLFHIKDSDRPMWVIATDWEMALKKWTQFIATENTMSIHDVEKPLGIDFVCDSQELIL
jgi:hypothetical protein